MTETIPPSGPVGYARDDRVFEKVEGLVEAGHRFLEILTHRMGFCHSAICRTATRRNRSGIRAKSTTSIVERVGASSSSSWIAARAVRETGAGPSMPMSIPDRSPSCSGRARPEQEGAVGRIRYMQLDH